MDSEYFPLELNRPRPGTIRIVWNDGNVRTYSARELREHCPCATCREKHGPAVSPVNLLPVLSPQELQPLDIASMRPVGNYAYAIQFSDGHTNGIFTMDLLRKLGAEE